MGVNWRSFFVTAESMTPLWQKSAITKSIFSVNTNPYWKRPFMGLGGVVPSYVLWLIGSRTKSWIELFNVPVGEDVSSFSHSYSSWHNTLRLRKMLKNMAKVKKLTSSLPFHSCQLMVTLQSNLYHDFFWGGGG
jgi:hypothetical protein